jgi:hypothetical protein
MPDPKFLARLKKAGLTLEQFRKMTPRQAIDAGLSEGDWREGIERNQTSPGFPDVTVGSHKNLPAQSSQDEDEEVTISQRRA